MARLTAMVALALVASLCVRGAEVVVPNAGFEEGPADQPAQWSWSLGEGGQGSAAVETEVVHGGRRAYRVIRSGVVGYTDLCSDLFPVEAGKVYTVSAWVYPRRHVRRGVYFMVNQFPAGSADGQLPNTFGSTTEPLVGGEWRQVEVQVEVRPGNDRLRLHCIQAFTPSDVTWDDVRVSLAGDTPAPRYEPASPEPLPDLAAAQAVVRQRTRATARVEVRGGRPRLVVDGQVLPWAFYVGPPFNWEAGAQIADFRDAGVRVFLVPLILGRDVYPGRGPWLGPGQYDFSGVDDVLWRALRVDPQAYVLFYMGCDAYRSWGADNPDEVTRDQNGAKAIVGMHPKRWGGDPQPGERFGPSIVSLKLRQDTAAALRELVRHVEASEAGKAVIGYDLCGYNDGQWFHWEGLGDGAIHLADYAPGAIASFREWLGRRYRGDEGALRLAWRQPLVTFATAQPPRGERMLADGFLLDPVTQTDIADFSRFHSDGVAETVDFLAGVVKEATPRPILCGTYYEDITCNSNSHISLRLHLQSPAMDYLTGPAAYSIRLPGYSGAVRSVFGSTLLHGKVYLTEQDWRSFRSAPDGPAENFAWGRAETAEIHNAMVRRECGMMLAFGLGTWWYDMSGGWFHDAGIMAGIAEAVRAFQLELATDRTPSADLAVVVSEDSNHWVTPKAQGQARFQGILEQIHQLNTSGVPYRLYLQADLADPRLPRHRAYLFLNAYRVDADEQRAIKALKGEGRTLIFLQAPGAIVAGDAAQAISELTGIRVAKAQGVREPGLEAIEVDHPLVRGLDGYLGTCTWPTDAPCFAVTDPQATAIARYRGTAQTAAAVRDLDTWRSVFIGVPGLTDAFVHNLAEVAGCWCAAAAGDAVYASDRFLTVHAIFPGTKALRLLRPARVTDLTTGQVLAERTDRLEVAMKRGETRWFVLAE